MTSDSLTINLIKKDKKFLDEFIRWTFTVGRVIIILTETIALSAFLYRFSLDRQLIDLHDSIKNKQIIVANLKNNEEKFRNLQERLALVANLDEAKEKSLTLIQDLVQFSTNDITINNVAVSETTVKIDITSNSIGSLSSFVNSLKDYKEIQSISVDQIENKPSQGIISISLTAQLSHSQPSLFKTTTSK